MPTTPAMRSQSRSFSFGRQPPATIRTSRFISLASPVRRIGMTSLSEPSFQRRQKAHSRRDLPAPLSLLPALVSEDESSLLRVHRQSSPTPQAAQRREQLWMDAAGSTLETSRRSLFPGPSVRRDGRESRQTGSRCQSRLALSITSQARSTNCLQYSIVLRLRTATFCTSRFAWTSPPLTSCIHPFTQPALAPPSTASAPVRLNRGPALRPGRSVATSPSGWSLACSTCTRWSSLPRPAQRRP
ncbi:hypothetical protein V7x_55480 [Crateriforma conspicua]|uniref:Uncharacterized protein n=1 Tax=Crateriforma conspicua TaxID=2527996 RepID=A0A5C6FD26_9PLAN|nr:hypothetical protein V7x_55480 [Crateriforma conspicua]